ncbi:unnamed protein product [Fraxinus pennsylvanica]|uniref:Uncharacterized protein n=1 Tax=Fraxinus pennsylvanica TaxID=56036 RepID=A0AAD2A765_9LAMI|nr:unnamed protein product [Fraxinus pennsylvanica]
MNQQYRSPCENSQLAFRGNEKVKNDAFRSPSIRPIGIYKLVTCAKFFNRREDKARVSNILITMSIWNEKSRGVINHWLVALTSQFDLKRCRSCDLLQASWISTCLPPRFSLIVRFSLRDSTWSVLAASPPLLPPPLCPSPTASPKFNCRNGEHNRLPVERLKIMQIFSHWEVSSPSFKGQAIQSREVGRTDSTNVKGPSGEIEGTVALVKSGPERVKTTPAGEYLTSALNDFDPEQYDSLAAISDGANKLLMLVLAAVIKAGASREHEILAEMAGLGNNAAVEGVTREEFHNPQQQITQLCSRLSVEKCEKLASYWTKSAIKSAIS